MANRDKLDRPGYLLVLRFFGGNKKKVNLWYRTRNPLLGGLSPDEMCAAGMEAKVLKFVKNAAEENKAP